MRAPRYLAATALVVLLAGCGGDSSETAAPPEVEPPAETTAPPAPPPTPPAPVPSSSVPVSWRTAGAFVWHETDVSPEALGAELRRAGFGWVALFVHDGLTEDPVEDDWVGRFREASGLPVGGWGALRTSPAAEAALADSLVANYGLDFYIANAEAEFDAGGTDGQSPERYGRSGHFVQAFRGLRPDLPAALSSYCRATSTTSTGRHGRMPVSRSCRRPTSTTSAQRPHRRRAFARPSAGSLRPPSLRPSGCTRASWPR